MPLIPGGGMVTEGTVRRGFTAALTRASGHRKTQQTGTRSGNRAPRIIYSE